MYQKVTDIIPKIFKFLKKLLQYSCQFFSSVEFALGLFDSDSDHIISLSQDTLKTGKPERRRTMSKVYDRKSIGDELTDACPGGEIATKKSSLKSINDRHEPLPTNEIAKKPSLRVRCEKPEPEGSREALVEKTSKPSDADLNPSKSLQSTRTSNSSFLRNTRKREVGRGFGGCKDNEGSLLDIKDVLLTIGSLVKN